MYLLSNFQSGTYAGNAVSCAAAIAVADVLKEENILANVQARFVRQHMVLRFIHPLMVVNCTALLNYLTPLMASEKTLFLHLTSLMFVVVD